MDKRTEKLMHFLNQSHSKYHAVAGLVRELEGAGYCRLQESGEWNLVPGGKYFMTRGGSSLMAFRIPRGKPAGFLLSASHCDWPTFKLKENGELNFGNYTRLAVERYGGMLMATWLDRPLSLAGRVTVDTEEGVETRLVDIDRDLLLIPNVAVHMNRGANDGYKWNAAVDMLPLMGGREAGGKLPELLEELAGGTILGHDLTLYVRQEARVWGIDQEFISAPALDDLECAWCCAQGFLNAGESESIPVLCVFDNEEVGSSSNQGADSNLLEGLLSRISACLGQDYYRLLASSFMVSADNSHAVHPNHPEFADSANAPVLGKGLTLKYNANQRYTTDGVSAALFRKVCTKADVPVQTYGIRADMLGGSTLGNISLNHVSVPSIDIGLPQLAMHSCYETAAVADAIYLEEAMAVYYGATLHCDGDGSYRLN